MRTKSDITPFYRGGRSAGEDLAAGDAHGLKSLNPVSILLCSGSRSQILQPRSKIIRRGLKSFVTDGAGLKSFVTSSAPARSGARNRSSARS